MWQEQKRLEKKLKKQSRTSRIFDEVRFAGISSVIARELARTKAATKIGKKLKNLR